MFNYFLGLKLFFGKCFVTLQQTTYQLNATTDILKLEEIIKVKKEGKNLVSMFLRIMKNVISLEDIKATIT